MQNLIIANVEWFDHYKGFGLLKTADHGELFIHISNVVGVINKFDTVLVDSIEEREIGRGHRARKNAQKVQKITEKLLASLYEVLKPANMGLLLKLYSSIGTNAVNEFVLSEIKTLKAVNNEDDYSQVLLWIRQLRASLDSSQKEVRENCLSYFHGISNEYYQNLLWLHYFHGFNILEITSLVDLANSISTDRRMFAIPKELFLTDHFLTGSFFLINTNIQDFIYAKCSGEKRNVVVETAREKVLNTEIIDFFSDQFTLLFNHTNIEADIELKTALSKKWVVINDIDILTSLINSFGKKFPHLLTMIFTSSSSETKDLLIRKWIDGVITVTHYDDVFEKMMKAFDFASSVVESTFTKKNSEGSFRVKIVKHFYNESKIIDTDSKYNFLCLLLNFEFDQEVYQIAINLASIKYRILLRDKFDQNELQTSWGLEKFITEMGLFLRYSKTAIGSLINAVYPNHDRHFFDRKEWSDDFTENAKNQRLNKLRILLLKEIATEKVRREITRKQIHSATDLASFTFCPASYLVSRAYEIKYDDNYEIFTGTELHEKKHLLSFLTDIRGRKGNLNIADRLLSNSDFSRILASDLNFNGHSEDSTIFFSKNKKLSGIPDYIFKDKDSIRFAVEEKFTFKKKTDVTNLYDNHRIQALTYLYGLSEFNFSNVYVIYWHLSGDYFYNEVTDYSIFNVSRSDQNKISIINAYEHVENFNKTGATKFYQNSLNFSKCIKCSLFTYCDYKKGNLTELKFSIE